MRFTEQMADVIANSEAAKPRRVSKRYSLEFEIEMEHVPYTVLAEGDDFESLLEDAQYNYKHSDNGNGFTPIGELPESKYDQVCQIIASEIADSDEARLERLADR